MDKLASDTQKAPRPRGRPPAFDREHGVEVAMGLFHARGYDHVGTAELCTAIGVRPPSLYAAYGSKLGLYERALERYGRSPMASFVMDAMADATTAPEAMSAVLLAAAERYAADSERRGCLALEGSVGGDTDARKRAGELVGATRAMLRSRLEELGVIDPNDDVEAVLVAMRGLSAAARAGGSARALRRAAERLVPETM